MNDLSKFNYLKYKQTKPKSRRVVYVADVLSLTVLELYVDEAAKLIGVSPTTIVNKADQSGYIIEPETKRIRYYLENNWYDAWLDLP